MLTMMMSTGSITASEFATFSDVLGARAAQRPDDRAYTFLADGEEQELTLTYLQVERKARAVAAALQARGLRGERAVLLLPPGLDFVTSFFGCAGAGVVAVPAYPPRGVGSRANDRIRAICRDARPAVVVTHARLVESIRQCLDDPAVECLAVDEIDAADAERWIDPHVSGDDLACLQYTSGSTAAPKGVMLTHANLLHNAKVICEAFGHTPRSSGVVWLPPYHDMGLMGGVLQPMYSGGPVVLMAPAAFLQRPMRWLRAVSRYKATTSGGPNFAYELCARAATDEDRRTLDLGSWEVAFNGAEPIDPGTLDRFARAFAPCGFLREAFYPCYGLAESTLLVTGGMRMSDFVIGSPDAAPNSLHVGCGHARGDGRVAIVDPQTLRRCRPGEVGEIWASGSSVARGYWEKPDETRQTFHARTASGEGPFLRTGDLGFLRHRELFVTGRLKNLINIRGVKYYPQDIERTVQDAHPALQPAGSAAFGLSVDGQERLVIAQEVQRSHRNVDPGQIFDAIREAVGRAHELDPYAIVLLKPGQLPRTTSGKIQHFACRDDYLAGRLDCVAEWKVAEPAPAPAAPTEAASVSGAEPLELWMTRRLAESLGASVDEIDPAEPFARYGLDSVKAATIASDLAARVGRDVPLTLFWDYPSIAALAEHLSEPAAA